MSASDDQALDQLKMSADELYREESFTDRRVGTVQRLTPITADGSVDTAREVVFTGQTQVMTPAGALPLNFELDADNLNDALAQFPQAAKEALDQTMKELQEMQRQQSGSGIMTPDQLGGGQGGLGGMGGGGQRGGIQLK